MDKPINHQPLSQKKIKIKMYHLDFKNLCNQLHFGIQIPILLLNLIPLHM
jgi:hypothetical protein